MKLFLFASIFILFSLKSAQCQTCTDSEFLLKEFSLSEFLGNEETCGDVKKIDPFIVYPNPTTDYFEVKGYVNPKGFIFDITGRLIKLIDVSTAVNISDLPSAIYLLNIDNRTEKIIKL